MAKYTNLQAETYPVYTLYSTPLHRLYANFDWIGFSTTTSHVGVGTYNFSVSLGEKSKATGLYKADSSGVPWVIESPTLMVCHVLLKYLEAGSYFSFGFANPTLGWESSAMDWSPSASPTDGTQLVCVSMSGNDPSGSCRLHCRSKRNVARSAIAPCGPVRWEASGAPDHRFAHLGIYYDGLRAYLLSAERQVASLSPFRIVTSIYCPLGVGAGWVPFFVLSADSTLDEMGMGATVDFGAIAVVSYPSIAKISRKYEVLV